MYHTAQTTTVLLFNEDKGINAIKRSAYLKGYTSLSAPSESERAVVSLDFSRVELLRALREQDRCETHTSAHLVRSRIQPPHQQPLRR
jgi:hypothetical protein